MFPFHRVLRNYGYGGEVQVEVSTLDASHFDEAVQLVDLAAGMAPVAGIFVMSLAMNDSPLSSMVSNPVQRGKRLPDVSPRSRASAAYRLMCCQCQAVQDLHEGEQGNTPLLPLLPLC